MFGVFLAFFFAFKPVAYEAGGITLYYPYPSLFHSFSSILFKALEKHVLPPQMKLINIGVFDTFLASIYMAVPMAAVFSMPVWIYETWSFVSPALKPKERRLVGYVVVPASILFLAGVLFSYEILLPILFRLMYLFTVGFGIQPTISVKAFVSIALAYMIALGLCFEAPIVMVALTSVGLVEPKEWFSGWRYAMVGCFFIALLISPGATGGIMEVSIALLLFTLYIGGAAVSKVIYGRRHSNTTA